MPFRMIDRLLQNAITVILGTASFYLVAQNHLPDAFPALKPFSTISKYFIPLIFASNLSWTLLTNRLSGKSVQNQGFLFFNFEKKIKIILRFSLPHPCYSKWNRFRGCAWICPENNDQGPSTYKYRKSRFMRLFCPLVNQYSEIVYIQ